LDSQCVSVTTSRSQQVEQLRAHVRQDDIARLQIAMHDAVVSRVRYELRSPETLAKLVLFDYAWRFSHQQRQESERIRRQVELVVSTYELPLLRINRKDAESCGHEVPTRVAAAPSGKEAAFDPISHRQRRFCLLECVAGQQHVATRSVIREHVPERPPIHDSGRGRFTD
jgi:hypothetical protein